MACRQFIYVCRSLVSFPHGDNLDSHTLCGWTTITIPIPLALRPVIALLRFFRPEHMADTCFCICSIRAKYLACILGPPYHTHLKSLLNLILVSSSSLLVLKWHQISQLKKNLWFEKRRARQGKTSSFFLSGLLYVHLTYMFFAKIPVDNPASQAKKNPMYVIF